MKSLKINFIGSGDFQVAQISGGHYDGKYLLTPYSLTSASEVDGSGFIVNLPDINNFNTDGNYQVTTGSRSDYFFSNNTEVFSSKNGLSVSGSLNVVHLPANGNWIGIADNLTTGSLKLIFFSQLSATPYGNFTTYDLSGEVQDIIELD